MATPGGRITGARELSLLGGRTSDEAIPELIFERGR